MHPQTCQTPSKRSEMPENLFDSVLPWNLENPVNSKSLHLLRSANRRRRQSAFKTHPAYSSVPQVDAVAEVVPKRIAEAGNLSAPQVDAAAKMVTKRIFQTTYSSVPQVNAAAEMVNCKAHSTGTRFATVKLGTGVGLKSVYPKWTHDTLNATRTIP